MLLIPTLLKILVYTESLMLSVTHKPFMISAIMLNVVILSVIMLRVVAPTKMLSFKLDLIEGTNH